MSKPRFDEPNSILFVYGSLLDTAHRVEVIGREVSAAPATISGYERGRKRYFYLRACPDTFTEGLLLFGLTDTDFAILDRYEEVPLLYTRERTEVVDQAGRAVRCWVYLPTAHALV